MRLFAAVAVWLATSSCAAAADIYVNNVGGDDLRDGRWPVVRGDEAGPYRTLARALRSATRGDRIIVANTGQPYRESITLQAASNSGLPETPFVIIGNGAVLDGTAPVPSEAWQAFRGDIFRFRPRKMSHHMLYLGDQPATRRAVAQQQLPALQPLEWCLLEGYVYFRVEANRLPADYELSHSALLVGVGLYEVRHVEIRDLVIQGFQLDGVNAHDGVFDGLLIGLTCRGNGRSGISVGGASRVRIEACLVGNNVVAQVRTEGYSRTQIVNCDLIDNTAPAIAREGGHVEVEP